MEWVWLVGAEPPPVPELAGLAAELHLADELPAVLAGLGGGWFEYGLVERAYAQHQPAEFARLVRAYSHTAVAATKYSASSCLAGTLGHLGRAGTVTYHPGPGTGRWDYNRQMSYWSCLPPQPWEYRTTWMDVIGDTTPGSKQDDLTCRAYVPGTKPVA